MLDAIVAQHQAPLLRYATRILSSPVAAQDVVQNVFIKLFRQWRPGTRPSQMLRSWLYRVTHNEAVDHMRREARLRRLHREHAAQHEPRGAGPDERHELFGLILDHLRKLELGEQQIVLLRLEEGLSYKEIAAVTGRSEGNIGCILHHAVRKLAKSMKQAGMVTTASFRVAGRGGD
ncbi:MAG: sigma-70 family RNA polymerase sigma factor [Kiritimatiellae bacterium]|nr:sigma-70 family RNA polymerase sigma factor [Kiritimatiellia bacterium]